MINPMGVENRMGLGEIKSNREVFKKSCPA